MTTTYKLFDGNVVALSQVTVDINRVTRQEAIAHVASHQWDAEIFNLWLDAYVKAHIDAKLPASCEFTRGQVVAVRDTALDGWTLGRFVEMAYSSYTSPSAVVVHQSGNSYPWVFCRAATQSETKEFLNT